ncbi:NAD-dependent protein deacetylase, SIR2 family [Clostridium fungisolvens]|uniref:Protein ADP-ribosyltransferase n=1 Tax=Clostridium fungisolvens TaxID=1604897 RepID=A0A6V8SJ19_9CLOT|nr:NAD-dependent protein deacetylase, SIR2 family [Clostridium fungisolvens]GFP77219.1 Protein ADP-ribosyltransferase [Clostridium fungisolvens]
MNTQIYLDNINKAAKLIQEADYILVGAGAGLSAAGGLNYGDSQLFKKWFPKLSEIDIDTIGEAISFYWNVDASNKRNFWAYWANHINKIRYEAPALKPYLDLFEILEHKNHFIITTNVDGQFIKAGFDKENIFAPQGDYGLFQCDKPCSDELYDNKVLIDKMIANMDTDKFEVLEEDIPHCPKCGSFMSKNLRVDDTFIEAPHMIKKKNYIDFVNNSMDGKLVLLELGVGFNTPSIIRWPFERITLKHPDAVLIRLNMDYPEVDKKIVHKSLCFDTDIMNIITDIKNMQYK